MRKDFKSIFSRSSHGGQGRCPARTGHCESVFLASFLQFPDVAAPIHLHNMHYVSCDHAKGNQS